MFGLNHLFGAFRRLTDSVNKTADLFDSLNGQLENRFSVTDKDMLILLPAPETESNGNGHSESKKKVKSRS